MRIERGSQLEYYQVAFFTACDSHWPFFLTCTRICGLLALFGIMCIGCFQKTPYFEFFTSKNPGPGAKYCGTYLGTNYFIFAPRGDHVKSRLFFWKQTIEFVQGIFAMNITCFLFCWIFIINCIRAWFILNCMKLLGH